MEERRLAPRKVSWLIFRKELIEVLRDRRAIFVAFALPVLLYPFLFVMLGAVAKIRDETKALSIGISGSSEGFAQYLVGRNLNVDSWDLDLEKVRDGSLAVLAHFEGTRVTLYYSATSFYSGEGLRRLRAALNAYRDDLIRNRLVENGLDLDPGRVAVLEPIDVSSADARASAKLGKFLPFLLVLIMLTGGSFAAIDVIAGEKERGTLETLFVHPVDRQSVVRGKFLVVFAMTAAALISNLGGLICALALSIAVGRPIEGFELSLEALPGPAVIAGVLLLTVPLAVLTSAILVAISAYSRSFREAQTYLLPATLLTLPLLLLAVAPQATLSSAVAVVPIANASLAIRELLEGRLAPGPLAVASASSVLYAWAALRQAQSLLLREDLVLGVEDPPGKSSADARARRAMLWASVLLGILYFAASWAQSLDLLRGLALTLWVFVLVPALAYPVMVGAPLRETLALRAPTLRSLLLVPGIAASLALLMVAYKGVQDQFLPVPLEMEEAFREFASHKASPVVAFLLFALSPAICEELLWRGAFQGELEPRGRPLRTALSVGLFFGLFHFSIYRLFLAGAVGFVLALVRQRSGSIFPCMLIHATYNTILCFAFEPLSGYLEATKLDWVLTHPASVAVAALCLVVSLRAMGAKPAQVREMVKA